MIFSTPVRALDTQSDIKDTPIWQERDKITGITVKFLWFCPNGCCINYKNFTFTVIDVDDVHGAFICENPCGKVFAEWCDGDGNVVIGFEYVVEFSYDA